jgi:hypothetical protein
MDPNPPKNNRPDPNRVKSSSVPNVPRNPPNRTATSSFYDMRGATFTSAGRDVVNNTYNGRGPYHTGDIYQQPQPYPPFPPTGYPSPNTNPMPQWSGRSDDLPTSSGYASPTTSPTAQWSGNFPSAGDILLLLLQLTKQPNTLNSHPTDSRYHTNNLRRYHSWYPASFRWDFF